MLLIGAVIWSYLGILFEILTRDGRLGALGGDDRVHVHGAAVARRPSARDGRVRRALRAGPHRAAVLRGRVLLHLELAQADFGAAFVVLAIASISFLGIGVMTAVFPLISPEKGIQLGFIAQGRCSSSPASTTASACCPGGCRRWRRSRRRPTRSRDPLRAPRRQGRHGSVGRHLAAARDRRRRDPARVLRLQPGEVYAKRNGLLKRSG